MQSRGSGLSEHSEHSDFSECPPLIEAMLEGTAGVFLQFGEAADPIEELTRLYHASLAARDCIISCAARCTAEVARLSRFGHFAEGLPIVEWIRNPTARPPASYLASASVHAPLVGLAQLAHYAHFVERAGVAWDEFVRKVKGATGHSLGLMAAVVAGISGSRETFAVNAEQGVACLLWLGCYLQNLVNKAFPPDDDAHFMLRVRGIPRQVLAGLVEHKMKKLQMAITFENGVDHFVVSGSPPALKELKSALLTMSTDENQDRVPFSKRKLVCTAEWVNGSIPFHHPMLHFAQPLILKEAQKAHFELPASSFLFSVYGTDCAIEDLAAGTDDVLPRVAQLLISTPVVWASAVRARSDVTHVLDFGPGDASLTEELLLGSGVQVLHVADPHDVPLLHADHWARLYGPRVRRARVSTKWSDMVGKPPVMIAGMTPTTSYNGLDLVAAASNLGFHCEFAAGGMATPSIFRERVRTLCAKLHPGVGITVNMVYLSVKQFAFQFPLVMEMRKEGFPIESITIGAGVPPLAKAKEIIRQCQESGMRYISFKPGSVSAIRSVVEIAAAHPEFYVVLQWTGGRGGGHHSFEDMHQPILQTYASIRALSNTFLVAGSGFGVLMEKVATFFV